MKLSKSSGKIAESVATERTYLYDRELVTVLIPSVLTILINGIYIHYD